MSRGQKSGIFFHFPTLICVHSWTMCRKLSIEYVSGRKGIVNQSPRMLNLGKAIAMAICPIIAYYLARAIMPDVS